MVGVVRPGGTNRCLRLGVPVRRGAARWGAAVLALTALGGLAAGCGGTNQSAGPTLIESGQIPRADLPTGGTKGHDALATADSTVPLAQQNPTTALFTAIGAFQACLTGLGESFIGIPNAKNPNTPADNPTYIKALTTCASKSNILNALKAAQSSQDNLTPAQVKKENKDYLKWRTCMIGRGWKIPEPTPNTKGLLFSFGGTGGGVPDYTPPPGQTLLSSPDLQACAAKAEQS